MQTVHLHKYTRSWSALKLVHPPCKVVQHTILRKCNTIHCVPVSSQCPQQTSISTSRTVHLKIWIAHLGHGLRQRLAFTIASIIITVNFVNKSAFVAEERKELKRPMNETVKWWQETMDDERVVRVSDGVYRNGRIRMVLQIMQERRFSGPCGMEETLFSWCNIGLTP